MKTENKSIISICPQQGKKESRDCFILSDPPEALNKYFQLSSKRSKRNGGTNHVGRLPGNEAHFKDIVLFHHFRAYNILKCSPCFPWNFPRVPMLRQFVIQMWNSERTLSFSALPRIPSMITLSSATPTRPQNSVRKLPPHFPRHYRSCYPNPHDWISLWNS